MIYPVVVILTVLYSHLHVFGLFLSVRFLPIHSRRYKNHVLDPWLIFGLPVESKIKMGVLIANWITNTFGDGDAIVREILEDKLQKLHFLWNFILGNF